MVLTCCVPKCRGNYKNGPKVAVFSFPKDEELRKRWIHAIKREDSFVPTKNTPVCELHFQKHEIERSTKHPIESTGEIITLELKHPRLVKGAVPSIYPSCPTYLSKPGSSQRKCPEAKRLKVEFQNIETAIAESLRTSVAYQNEKSFSTLDEAYTKILKLQLDKWLIAKGTHNLCFFYVDEQPRASLKFNAFISEDLFMFVEQMGTAVDKIICRDKTQINFPIKVSDVNMVENVITETCYFLKQCPRDRIAHKKNSIQFLKEQINLLKVSSVYRQRYSWEMALFCSILFSISPHAYKFLRSSGNITIPSPRTIKSICSGLSTSPQLEQSDLTFLKYVTSKFKYLEQNDTTVVLMVDEIHIKPYMDYKSGNIVGGAYNESKCATSAHVFMIHSMLSKYKDVVHILPVKTLKAEDLHIFIKKVVLGLENIGFEVISVVTDNHKINNKAMSIFADPPAVLNEYVHPADSSRPLFYIIDTVHILKNIRNNWLNQKHVQSMKYPSITGPEIKEASFNALKELHRKEQNQLLKYGYTLSLKALYPTPIERQNVKLVLQVFNYSIVAALRQIGPTIFLENFEETADYIELICKWWDIANVKTPLKGLRQKNTFQQPITKNSVNIFQFLQEFIAWLDRWQASDISFGRLTRETHNALRHTTDGLLKISNYCLTIKNYNYVLPGKLQTDKLEERFGKYRYEAGSQYLVSIRQIFESEMKLRLTSVIPLILKSKIYGDIPLTKEDILTFTEANENESSSEIVMSDSLKNICSSINASDIENIEENVWPPLVYVAGYAAYAICKKIQCEYCTVFLKEEQHSETYYSLITETSRGGLCYPSEAVILTVAYVYITLQKLLEEELEYLKQNNQAEILRIFAFQFIFFDLQIEFLEGHNCSKHKDEVLLKMLLKPISNILLKNYIKKHNDRTATKSMPHLKRIKPTKNI